MNSNNFGRLLIIALAVQFGSWTNCSAAEPPSFTRPPAAVLDGDAVKVEFAVDRLTDVAVIVEDAQRKVV